MNVFKLIIFVFIILPLMCIVGGAYHASRGADRHWHKFWEFFQPEKLFKP